MKLIHLLMLGILTSCGMLSLPNEHIEIDFDFDMKSTSAPKITPEENAV